MASRLPQARKRFTQAADSRRLPRFAVGLREPPRVENTHRVAQAHELWPSRRPQASEHRRILQWLKETGIGTVMIRKRRHEGPALLYTCMRQAPWLHDPVPANR
jgi:hypothetical protein